MFWRMQNDDRYLIHTSLRRLSEETYSMRQMLGLTHVGLSHRWPALNVESSSITFRLKLKALSTAAKGLLSLVPQVIYTFPCWGIALDVPSVCNAFPPDSHVGGSIICWLNKLFQVGCLRTFQEKKNPPIFILFKVCKVVCPTFIFKGEIFVAQGSDSSRLFWRMTFSLYGF